MASNSATITGLEETKRFLRDFPVDIVAECFPAALAAAADVIENEVAARIPRAEKQSESAREYGTLSEDLSTEIAIEPQQLRGSARVGFERVGYVARFIEYGHMQTTHDGRPVGHVPAHPFMRPAADSAEDRAVDAFSESIDSHLAKG